jgi:hypothetical protein
VFLREPTDYPGRDARINVRARVMTRRSNGAHGIDQWIDVPFLPGSPEANYCVIRKNNQRSQELLEKVAAEVVRAVDALAAQESAANFRVTRASVAGPAEALKRVYVPMIVTTAKLYICDADYEKVDLQTGEVPGPTAIEVPAVRFMKSLVSLDPRLSSANTAEEFAQQSERSVVVVQAAHFADFLNGWDLSRRMPTQLLEALTL